MGSKSSYEDLEKRIQELEQELNSCKSQEKQSGRHGDDGENRLAYERYKSLVENINEIVFSTDAQAQITYVSPNIFKVSGFKQEEVIGRNFVEFVYPEDLASRMDQFQKIMEGENQVTEYRMMGKDGRIIWVRANARAMMTEEGFTGLQGILVDITDSKIMEEDLRKSEERFRDLFNNAQVGLVRTRLGDGKVLAINELCARMFQIAPEDLQGLRSTDFYANAKDRQFMVEILQANGMIENHEVLMRRKDGSEFWASYSLRIYPETGAVEGVIIDISQRKAAEEALQRSEERFKSLITQSPISYEYYGMDGTLLENNPAHCRMWGTTREALVGNYNLFQDPAIMNDPSKRKILNKVFSGEVVRVPPFQIRPTSRKKESEKELWVKATMYPIKQNGEVVNVVNVLEDVTEQKMMEAKLEETNKQLVLAAREAGMAEVATGVLHNIGNILNSVHVTAGAILEKMENSRMVNFERTGGMLKENLDSIGEYLTLDPKGKKLPAYLAELAAHMSGERRKLIEDAKQLREYIDHMVTIISLQQSFGKAAGLTEITDIQEIVEAAVTLHKAALIRHGIELKRGFEDLPPILADRNRVMQIMVNLIANAKHAIKNSEVERGEINVSIRKVGEDQLAISVSDNGVGIPPENLDRIFTHGFTTRKRGHGFGLHSGSIAAAEMGGGLSAQSKGEGHGAAFTLTIPFKTPDGENSR
ncbi:PAS/PAC sensor signal transduction histidine kinase [Desulfatibacillum aliphaticivorans]|uniref:histidine kinase n=1 Tax=Desulfatibacillum aliphaticivorans TaxID=218208 RepID=B8FB39_DESAL|nr:PAS domain S-box protein [Desulfatibacillum aliphaticivorans]ACL04125.1 PAS/PAC sensor signal transduction histidine kinase [Desulfatibacillum aliphaticivorans]